MSILPPLTSRRFAVLSLLAAAAPAHLTLASNPVPTPNQVAQADPMESVDTAPAARSINAFGLECFKSLARAKPGDNVFISPSSIARALTMTAEGATDETRAEMTRVLNLPQGDLSSVHQAHLALTQRFLAGAGAPDNAVRERVTKLKRELDDLNERIEAANARGSDFGKARTLAKQADAIADELNALYAKVDLYTLNQADAVWIERAYPINPAYLGTLERFYAKGACTPIDFRSRPEHARKAINTWVEDQTEHRIKDLIPSGAITADTRLVLASAVYFLGQWVTPFPEHASRESEFTLASGELTRTRTMHHEWRQSVPYAAFNSSGEFFDTPTMVPENEADRPPVYPDQGGFTMIELPYKGKDLSMVLFLPRTPEGLSQLESTLTPEKLDQSLAKLTPRTVHTHVPKFKASFESDLVGTLKAMGMNRAFAPGAEPHGAQFSAMTTSADSEHALNITGVLHKAWIDVTEKGTEAAAATAVMMGVTSAAVHRDPVKLVPFHPIFRADHPFVYVIRDRPSGALLFIGRYVKPS